MSNLPETIVPPSPRGKRTRVTTDVRLADTCAEATIDVAPHEITGRLPAPLEDGVPTVDSAGATRVRLTVLAISTSPTAALLAAEVAIQDAIQLHGDGPAKAGPVRKALVLVVAALARLEVGR